MTHQLRVLPQAPRRVPEEGEIREVLAMLSRKTAADELGDTLLPGLLGSVPPLQDLGLPPVQVLRSLQLPTDEASRLSPTGEGRDRMISQEIAVVVQRRP